MIESLTNLVIRGLMDLIEQLIAVTEESRRAEAAREARALAETLARGIPGRSSLPSRAVERPGLGL